MENTENTPFNFEQASYVDLLDEAKRLNGLVADLSGELTTLKNKLSYVETAFSNRNRQVDEVSEIIEQLIENQEISDEQTISDLARILDLDLEREVEVEFSISGTLTISLPYSVKVEDISEYDFDVEVTSSSYDISNQDLSIDSVSSLSQWVR